MDIDLLYQNIKFKCAQYDISISQLEKELHFGGGAIGKWKQSAPSIEKVMAVADYFHVSLDELCGIKQAKQEKAFMDRLLQRTVEGDIKWSYGHYGELFGSRSGFIQNYSEMYGARYDVGRFLIVQDESGLELYMALEDGQYLKQKENIQQLQELWKTIKDKEQELQGKIDEYKKNFTDN